MSDPEIPQKSLNFSPRTYSHISAAVLRQSGMSLIELAERQPEIAYIALVEAAAQASRSADALLDENDQVIMSKEADGYDVPGEAAERLIRKTYFSDLIGEQVKLEVCVRENHSSENIPMLSLVADLSKIDPTTIRALE